MINVGERIQIDVLAIEYVEGSNTIWIHGLCGTVLRIKTTGKIITDDDCNAPGPHGDVMATGDIKICTPGGRL